MSVKTESGSRGHVTYWESTVVSLAPLLARTHMTSTK